MRLHESKGAVAFSCHSANSKTRSKPTKRRLRYSVRALLIAITLLCVGLGWVSWRIRRQIARTEVQRRVIALVESHGGYVRYGWGPRGDENWVRKYLVEDGVVEVDLSNTQVTDISDLARLRGLRVLRLSNTPVSDISPLRGLTWLTWISLSNTSVRDLSPLRTLPRLTHLDLSGTPVTDIGELKGLTNIEELSLANTKIKNISALTESRFYSEVDLSGMPNADFSPLSDMHQVNFLMLRNNQISNIQPLLDLHFVQEIDLRGTRISADDRQRLLTSKPNCRFIFARSKQK